MVPKHVEGWWVAALLVAVSAVSGCKGTGAGANRPVPGPPAPPGAAAAPDAAEERAATVPPGAEGAQTSPSALASTPDAEPRAADQGLADATPPAPTLAALRREAHRVVDDWHAAAAVGDARRYLGHMADDAVFMGTDSTERWDLAAFRAYVEQYMTAGHGWIYVPTDRGLVVPEASSLAWFDERLKSDSYGELRGTGVLRRDGDTWRIVHYSLTYTVPNAVAGEVTELIRGQ